MTRAHDVIDQALGLSTMFLDDGEVDLTMAIRVAGDARLGVLSRGTRGPRRRRSPAAELAVLLAALKPEAVAMAMPSRVRDRQTQDVLSRGVMAVGIDVSGGGNRMDALHVVLDERDGGGLVEGARCPVDVATSPLASLLHDAVVRTTVDLPVAAVAVVLDLWGHRVATDVREPLPPDHPLMASIAPGTSPARAVHRVARLADELERRHLPEGTLDERTACPGVPYDLPHGWVPACPI